MRWALLWNKIRKHGLYIAFIIVAIIPVFLALIGVLISTFWAVSLIVILGILTFLDRRATEKSDENLSSSVTELNTQSSENKVKLEKIDRDTSEQKDKLTELVEKKKSALVLLDKLLTQGLIDEEEIYKHMPTSDVFTLLCFPTPFKEIKVGNKTYRGGNRLYPCLLKDMGFVRLSRRGTDYITTPRRLIKPFKNLVYLRDSILIEVDKVLKKEWEAYLKGLRKKKSAGFRTIYNGLQNDDYKKHLKFSIALMRGKLDEKNVKSLEGKKIYNKDFESLLREEIDFKYIDLPRQKRVEIKRVISDASIELFFYGITKEGLDKIKKLEPTLKHELEISKFTDYLNKSDEDIIRILKTGFSDEEAQINAQILKQRVNEYSRALKDLGISL